jgi:hypothetical protein
MLIIVGLSYFEGFNMSLMLCYANTNQVLLLTSKQWETAIKLYDGVQTIEKRSFEEGLKKSSQKKVFLWRHLGGTTFPVSRKLLVNY